MQNSQNSQTSFVDLINESSLSRLWRKYKEFDSGTISACRGNKTADENKQNTAKLKTELIRRGYSVTAINGVYIENYGKPNAKEVHEKSFIVFDQSGSGDLKKDLIDLGKQYEQDSITFNSVSDGKYYLIGTNDTGYPGLGKEIVLGKPMFGKDGEFHSKINGRPFVFESLTGGDFDTKLRDMNISRIMSVRKSPDYVLPD